ncbi:MAG: energy transducer TonB [Bdellovibrio sp.]|nr:MAG: energy transducer TonB [Bdellovibrio sp.]
MSTSKQQLHLSLLISLLLHALLLLSLYKADLFLKKEAPLPLQVQIIDAPPTKNRKTKHFLSDKKRRTHKEQMARSSSFRHNLFIPSTSQSPHKPRTKKNNEGLVLQTQEPKIYGSKVSLFVPQIKQGGFTALNTDQFIFYTFYARTNEQIGSRWVFNIQNSRDELKRSSLKSPFSSQKHITQLEVILKPNGDLAKIHLLKSSQIPALDQAAVLAFQQAAPFANPPEEMVQEDGRIHLYYNFIVVLDPRYWARQ